MFFSPVFSESSNLGETVRQSAVSEFSDSDQDAFDELDMLTPHTRSLQSLENAQNESCGGCSSDSGVLPAIKYYIYDAQLIFCIVKFK